MRNSKRLEADDLNYKNHGESGCVFLTGTSESTVKDYYGFSVASDDAVIASINYGKYESLYSGDITSVTLQNGLYFPIKFESITLSAGSLIL
jgi:hypothetical protein